MLNSLSLSLPFSLCSSPLFPPLPLILTSNLLPPLSLSSFPLTSLFHQSPSSPPPSSTLHPLSSSLLLPLPSLLLPPPSLLLPPSLYPSYSLG